MPHKKLPSHYALPAIVISTLLVAIVISAWQEPQSTPPGGNASSSLNVGSVAQYREGPLRLGGVFQTDQATFLARWGGNVGIGTTSTEATLHVVSGNDGTLKIGTNSGTSAQLCLNNQCFTKTDLMAAGGSNRPAYISPCVDTLQSCSTAPGFLHLECPPGWTVVSNSAYCISSYSPSYTPNIIYSGCWVCQNTFSPPSQVTGLTATPGNTQAVLSWTAPFSGGSAITAYKVYRGTASGGEILLTTGGCSGLGSVLTCTDTGLTNRITYYYKVSAVSANGEGPQSDEVSAIFTVPSKVTGLTATPSYAQAVLSWTSPNNGGSAITNYKVYRSTISGAETLLTTLGNVLTYTNTGLTNGATYYYTVSAINAVGEGSQSDEVSAVLEPYLTWSGSTHSVSQCLTLGGAVYDTGSGTICRYSGASVPSGWTQAANWQRYSVSSWGGDDCGRWGSTGPTTWSNTLAYNYSVGAYIGNYDRGAPCNCNYWNTLTPMTATCSGVVTVNNPDTNRVEVGIY